MRSLKLLAALAVVLGLATAPAMAMEHKAAAPAKEEGKHHDKKHHDKKHDAKEEAAPAMESAPAMEAAPAAEHK